MAENVAWREDFPSGGRRQSMTRRSWQVLKLGLVCWRASTSDAFSGLRPAAGRAILAN